MAYRVDLTQRAAGDLARLYLAIDAARSGPAHAWFKALERLILTLDDHPSRGAVIQEDGRFHQLLHGRKPNVYRVIYAIDGPNSLVTVLHIRHGRRDAATLDAIGVDE